MKLFELFSPKNAMNKILLAFIFYVVATVSFSGYVMKWGWVNTWEPAAFKAMYDGTAERPFVYRRLLYDSAKKIESAMSDKFKKKITHSLEKRNFTKYFSNVPIEEKYYLEYHLVYFMSFACLFAMLFVLRKIALELTTSNNASTISACCFGLLLPLVDPMIFYDFSELLFFSLAILFSLKGRWQPLLVLTPIAAYNKESFLFFLATLLPILSMKSGIKKASIITVIAMFLSGSVYLYVRSVFEGNHGSNAIYQLPHHLEIMTDYHSWFATQIQFGMLFGYGTFLPYLLLLAWIVKVAWRKIPAGLKYHIIFAAFLNSSLYLLFCYPNETRNFTISYMGFFIILTTYIKEIFDTEGRYSQ